VRWCPSTLEITLSNWLKIRMGRILPGVVAILDPAAHEVIAFIKLVQETANLAGIALEIGAESEDDCSAGRPEPGGECSRLARPAGESQATDLGRLAPGHDANDLPGSVAAAIVDEDDLEGVIPGQFGGNPLEEMDARWPSRVVRLVYTRDRLRRRV
jgi:hypothetical protein